MAQEWYLLNSTHDIVSGYEGDALNDFGADGFIESLNTDVATEVELCNYDLSERTKLRAIIQNTTTDTKLKTLSRHALFPIGTCKAGMYVYYKNRYWLIVGIVDDNKVYEKAILSICNYLLSWINDDGEIIQRWVNVESASQYNNGESNIINFYIRSDQLMVYFPDDEQSLLIDSGKRFIIDKRCTIYEKHFDDNTTESTGNPLTVYKITRNDSVLYNYLDSGVIAYIMSQTEQGDQDGYYVIGEQGYWLCDYMKHEEVPTALSCDILTDSDCLYIDLEPSVFMPVFYDADGNILSTNIPEYTMTIDHNLGSTLEIQSEGNALSVFTCDYKLNNKTFNVVLRASGYTTATKTVHIREFI